jgi:hypothetical protein
MINKMPDHQVTPFILHFAQLLPPIPTLQINIVDESASRLNVTSPETRFTKVAAETTDDA